MSLQDADILELVDRYGFIAQKYVELAIELAPKLEKFGKYRKELQLLTTEFVRRGVKIKERDDLEKLVKAELEKRRKQADGKETVDEHRPREPVQDSE